MKKSKIKYGFFKNLTDYFNKLNNKHYNKSQIQYLFHKRDAALIDASEAMLGESDIIANKNNEKFNNLLKKIK